MHRIEIIHKKNFTDGREKNLKKLIKEELGISLIEIKTANVYNLFGEFNDSEVKTLKNELFCDTVYQTAELGFTIAKKIDFDFCIEVSYLPGVTDNVGRTSAKGISNILKRKINDNDVRSSMLYFLKGSLTDADCKKIAEKILCNALIENYFILSKDDVKNGKSITYKKPEEIEINPPYFDTIDLEISDEKLLEISNKMILSLSLSEMKAIRDYYKLEDVKIKRKARELPMSPTDCELEVFAQTWSEHCKHKIFSADINYKDENGIEKKIKSLFKTYIKDSTEILMKKRKDLLSVFEDNSGIVAFNKKYAYCMKAETHNSPSALDPYGGAMTGIVGVNRDIIGTGMGAYPIFNTDVFCFGNPFLPDKEVPDGLMHPRRIMRGVHRGIKDGGNESGIPTVNGSITFHNSFLGKPLVFCGTGGLLPLKVKKKDSYKKYTKKGDLIVMCGGRIGKDGIHGATFSSTHLSDASPTSAVQIGDPITQKKMLDFIIEARDLGLYTGLTDNGAGGLSSSVGEMARITGGAILNLEQCPLKYKGLKPWEILLSEAQERMTLSVSKNKIEELLDLSARHDVESNVIGEFTDSCAFETRYNDETICFIDMDMLHDGLPKLELSAEWIKPDEKRIPEISNNYRESLHKLLASPNIASKEYWVRMYDHEVQGRTVVKPFSGKENDGPSDGAVLKIFPDSDEGLIVTHGIIPRYSLIDTYQMSANAIDEAVRSAIILGAEPDKLVGLDNFCWPDPVESEYTKDGKYKLAQLVRANEAIYDVTLKYNTPCISGKDSMKNDYKSNDKKISVLPTLLFTVIGKTENVKLAVTHYFKNPGDLIILLGETKPELGASEYYMQNNITGGIVPKVDPDTALDLYRNYNKALKAALVKSAHDLSDGGLAVALAEASFSGNLGAVVDISSLGEITSEEKLFSESASRILITVSEKNKKNILDIFKKQKVYIIGEVTSDTKLAVKDKNNILIDDDIFELKNIWKNALIF